MSGHVYKPSLFRMSAERKQKGQRGKKGKNKNVFCPFCLFALFAYFSPLAMWFTYASHTKHWARETLQAIDLSFSTILSLARPSP